MVSSERGRVFIGATNMHPPIGTCGIFDSYTGIVEIIGWSGTVAKSRCGKRFAANQLYVIT